MRSSRFSRKRSIRRPLKRAAALGVASVVLLPGCYTRLNHPGVSNPIFLGERMHIGEERRFELGEEREKYRDKSLNGYLWSLLPTGDEYSSRDRMAAAARQAKRRLGLSSYRAVQLKGLEVGSSSLFLGFMLAIGTTIEFWGELVEVVPPAEAFEEPESGS